MPRINTRTPHLWGCGWGPKFTRHANRNCATQHVSSRSYRVQYHALDLEEFDLSKLCTRPACRADYTDDHRSVFRQELERRAATMVWQSLYAAGYAERYALEKQQNTRTKLGIHPTILPPQNWSEKATLELAHLLDQPRLTADQVWSSVAAGHSADIYPTLFNLHETALVKVGFYDGWERDWLNASPMSDTDPHEFFSEGTQGCNHEGHEAVLLGTLGITPSTPTATVNLATAMMLKDYASWSETFWIQKLDPQGPSGATFSSLVTARDPHWLFNGQALDSRHADLWDAVLAALT